LIVLSTENLLATMSMFTFESNQKMSYFLMEKSSRLK